MKAEGFRADGLQDERLFFVGLVLKRFGFQG